MKKALLVMLFCCVTLSLFAQTGAIKGRVLTRNGAPVSGISVRLDHSRRGDITGSDGHYQVRGLAAGSWTVEVSGLGVASQQRSVTLRGGETVELTFVLEETTAQLRAITVRGARNRFAGKESSYAARMPLSYIENPQSYSVANRELLEEKVVTDYQAAVRAIPGIAVSTEDYQGSSVVFLRGFATNPYIRNGLYYMNLVSGDPANTERLEAIKGPGGALYGSQGVSYGGLINRVTKKPERRNGGELGLVLGGFGLARLTADVNAVLDADTALLLRVNGAASWQQSFQDNGYQRSFLFAPSLYARVNDRLAIWIDAEVNSKARPALTSYPVYSAGSYGRYDRVPLDYFKSYGSDKVDYPPSATRNIYVKVDYRLGEHWQLSGNVGYSDFNFNCGTIGLSLLGEDSLMRDLYDFYWQYNSIDIQPNLNGEFRIGNLRNRVLIGLDYQQLNTVATGYYLGPQDTLSLSAGSVPYFPVTRIRASDAYAASYYEMDFRQKAYAAYASDVLSVGDRLNLLLSLRYDHYENSGYQDRGAPGTAAGPDAGALAPKLGLTYQVLKGHLTLFGNYMQGINYIAPDMRGHVFDPERARQLEGGVKIELPGGGLSSTISYYDILVRDKVRADPANPLLSIQDGTQRSRGVDADVMAIPFRGLSIVLGYEYNSNRYLKSDEGLKNKRPFGTPPHSGNGWASYSVSRGLLAGAGLGAGVVYCDDFFGTDDNMLIIPGHTVVGGTVFYNRPRCRLALSMDNIGNQRYWDIYGTPQMTRRLKLALAFRF